MKQIEVVTPEEAEQLIRCRHWARRKMKSILWGALLLYGELFYELFTFVRELILGIKKKRDDKCTFKNISYLCNRLTQVHF